MSTAKKSDYSVNDLSRFSPWPARLLGLEPWGKKHKTPEEIIREYETEKWGQLLAKVRSLKREVSVDEVDEWIFNDIPDSLCSIEGGLELLPAMEAHQRYKKIVKQVIESYLPAPALVELGAGYGTVILALAKRNQFARMHIMAGEYTVSGIELMRRLSKAQGISIELSHCDIGSANIVDMAIPQNAIIFTSYVTPYVSKLSTDFINALSAFRPKVVIHIEPCYEHCDDTSLLGLMRRRYIEVNDYNTNLVTLLHDQKQQGIIKILDEHPAVFGMNPLLTASVLTWVPMD